ncbi:hypothetical protein [Simkania sp.]|uniref:hypothetical protein n=1 Tax=Simkania sp. TaxID=34094 RepID=UPI003B51E43E
MSDLAEKKCLSTLLKLDPDRVCYASSNRAVGEWNLLLIEKLVKEAVDHVPTKLSKIDIEQYGQLKERLGRISCQFMAHNYDSAPISRQIDALSHKLEPFKKSIHPLIEKTFEHVLTKQISELSRDNLKEEKSRQFIRDLLAFFDRYLIPAMYHLKTPELREAMRELLKKIVKVKETLDPLDYDGALEEGIVTLVKHFIFNLITSDRIYHNLLNYQEGSLDLSDVKLCQKAAYSINEFMLKRLIPFLLDPEIIPCREEIVKIYWNLSTLNRELIDRHSKDGAILFRSLNVLEELI